MQINYKRTTYILGVAAIALTISLLISVSVLAGSITSSAAPGSTITVCDKEDS